MATQEENAQLNKDEAKKIKLESIFGKEIRSLFNRMSKVNSQTIKATGNPISGEKFRNEWETILEKHYIRVQDRFFGSVVDTLPVEDQEISDDELSLLLSNFIIWREKEANSVASVITNTNNKQLLESTNQARQTLIEQEEPVDNITLALTTAAIFKRLYSPRINQIKITETQDSAESTKLIEASVLSGLDPRRVLNPVGLRIEEESSKVWHTVGDIHVRPIHNEVNGTEIPINDVFISGGERLLHPGDTTQGATAKNIIHCRCSLTFEIKRVRR